MNRIFAIIYLLSVTFLAAQDLDSLFNKYTELKQPLNVEKPASIGDVQELPQKCALEIQSLIMENLQNFRPDQRLKIEELKSRNPLQTSIVSPKGYFRIHFDTTGVNTPGYDINQFAASADSAYDFEINFLGYPAPPADNGEGGDDLYDIYIIDQNGVYYGYTEPEANVGDSLYTSYMVIDNDYEPSERYASTYLNGARVTVAHEFHHGVQMGNYILRSADTYYYEITSTAMEEFVFDYVNDYYAYMNSYFNQPMRSFSKTAGGGYDLAVWNIYIQERFNKIQPNLGYEIIKRSWELMRNDRALTSIALALSQFGYTFKCEFNKFGMWTFLTGYRINNLSNDIERFEEAGNYPQIKIITKIDYIPPKKTVNVSSEPVTNTFLQFAAVNNNLPDTLISIISECNISAGVSSPNSSQMIEYSLMSQSEDGSVKINDLYYSKIVGDNSPFIKEGNLFNNLPLDVMFAREEIDYAYPQPFEYARHRFLYLPVSPDPSLQAQLYIYSVSMDLVYSGPAQIFANDKIVVQWDGKDSDGKNLPGGVYIYVTKAGDSVKKGKIVIFNE